MWNKCHLKDWRIYWYLTCINRSIIISSVLRTELQHTKLRVFFLLTTGSVVRSSIIPIVWWYLSRRWSMDRSTEILIFFLLICKSFSVWEADESYINMHSVVGPLQYFTCYFLLLIFLEDIHIFVVLDVLAAFIASVLLVLPLTILDCFVSNMSRSWF